MKIALISDIHSNCLALKAVLADIKKQGIKEISCLGDLIGYAPFPDKVFPIIKNPENNIKTVMGNYDEAVAFEKKDCGCGYKDENSVRMGDISYDWTLKHTSEENKEWIKKLPKELRLRVGDKRILMVHGSPEEISGRVDIMKDKQITSMMEEANADILFCAHTHIPYHKIIGDKHVVNAGSVGRPRNKNQQASYVIVDLNGGFKVKPRFVGYDFESFAKEIENSKMPKNNFAEVIRTGYWTF